MPKLIFMDKNFSGKVYEIVLEKTTVGRGDSNTLVIRDSSLSSQHCEILMNGPEIIVRDLDSRNGTFVNGARLNKQSQVKSGQIVRFGSVEARLELEPSRNDSDTAEITAVYSLGKVMAEKRRAEKQFKPETASMQLEPEAHGPPEQQTILIPRSAAPPAAPALVEASKPQESSSTKRLGVVALVIAIGVVVLLWLVFRSR